MADNNYSETTFSAGRLAHSAAVCSYQALQNGPAGPGVGLGINPLHAAVQTGDRAQVERVLTATDAADLDARDASSRTPLLLAATAGAPELMQLLLQRGADPSIAALKGQTPLHAAAARGCLQSVQLLLQRGGAAQLSTKNAAGLTPLGVTRSAVCVRELAATGGVLSPADLPLLLRERPAVLRELLDRGVQSDSDGVLRVTYQVLRDVGGDYPFEAELVSRMQQSGRWQMLGHPAVQLLLEVTRQDTLWMAVTSLVFSVVFLVVLCAVVLLDLYHVETRNKQMLTWVLLTLNCVRILVQLVRLPFIGTHVFCKLRFWPEVALILLTFLVVLLTHAEAKRPVHAAAILSGFLELTLVVESIPKGKATKAISSLLHVTRMIFCYLLAYLPILIGFTIAFFVMLKEDMADQKNSLFRGEMLVMTIAAMIIGEVGVTEMNALAPRPSGGSVVCTIIFILFLVLVPVVMLNMLLALTINDTNKFLSKGSSEYLHHVASMTAVNQCATSSLRRQLQRLNDKLPGWLSSCVSALTSSWRSALPRPLEIESSSSVTLVVNPVEDNGKTACVTTSGSKRCYRVSRSVRNDLYQIVQERAAAEAGGTEAKPPLSGQDRAHQEVPQALIVQLRETRDMHERMAQQQEKMTQQQERTAQQQERTAQQQERTAQQLEEMTQQLHAMREERVKWLYAMPERQANSV